jgi:hypothetical protein
MDISSPTKSQAYGAPDIWPWPQIDAKKSQTQTQLPFSQHSDKAHAAISLYEIYCRKMPYLSRHVALNMMAVRSRSCTPRELSDLGRNNRDRHVALTPRCARLYLTVLHEASVSR